MAAARRCEAALRAVTRTFEPSLSCIPTIMRAEAARRNRAASTWSLNRTSVTWSMATMVPPRSIFPSPTWMVTLRPMALGSWTCQWKGMSASTKGGLGGGTVSRRRVSPMPGWGGRGGWARLRPMARSARVSTSGGAVTTAVA
jgi:hypothetical protein